MTTAPIILFTYNRPWHTRQTVEALQRNDLAAESELFIYSDGPKSAADKESVSEVREYVRSIEGFKRIKIIQRESNMGLAKSVIDGVTDVIGDYGKIIVVEDDLISSCNFLRFMNTALTMYENRQDIFSVAGYSFLDKLPEDYDAQVYMSPRASSWGWGTWVDRWNKADWDVTDYRDFVKDRKARQLFNTGGDDLSDMLMRQQRGELDSWAIRWAYAHFRNRAYCVTPVVSKIVNIGFDSSGTHCNDSNKYDVVLDDCAREINLPENIRPDEAVIKKVTGFHRISFFERVKIALGRYITA